MAKHTPGPWHLIGHGQNQAISGTTGADWSQDRYFVARIDASSEANARLIAAAPDLLAACKVTLANLELIGVHPDTLPMTALRDAIAKAEREPATA